jgi:hypothetical protein
MSSHSVNSTLGPAQQVLNTTELLENILSFLPMPHVLGKSRVTRKWKAVIDNSPALQDKLFLRYKDSQAEVLRCDHLFTTPIELNPLLGWENQAKLHVTHEIVVAHPKPFHPSLAGLKVVLGKFNTAYIRHRFGQSWQREQYDSSWCKMYLTKPPVTDIVIHVPITVGPAGYTGSLDDHITANIHSEHGVTLGLLHETVEGTLRTFRMKDGRPRAQQRKEGPLKEDDYVKGWGKKERIMFLVQPKEDAADLELQ